MISVSGYKPNKQIFNITKTGNLSAKVELIIMKSSGIDGEEQLLMLPQNHGKVREQLS